MKNLKHNDQIRRTDDEFSPVITIGTVAGMCRSDFERYGEVYCWTDDESVEGWMEKDIEKAIKIHELVERGRGHDIVWANLHAACLTSNYPGKDEEMLKKREAYANAPVIEDGEIVIIEGRKMRTVYKRRTCSDCIHFEEVG